MKNLDLARVRLLILATLPLLAFSLNCATQAMLWTEQARVTIRPDEVGRPFMTGKDSFCILITGRLYCDKVRHKSYWSFHYYDKVDNSEFSIKLEPDPGPQKEAPDFLPAAASHNGTAVYCHENRILIMTPHASVDCDDSTNAVRLVPEVFLQGHTLFIKLEDRPGFVKMVSTHGMRKPPVILPSPPADALRLEAHRIEYSPLIVTSYRLKESEHSAHTEVFRLPEADTQYHLTIVVGNRSAPRFLHATGTFCLQPFAFLEMLLLTLSPSNSYECIYRDRDLRQCSP